MTSDVSRHLAPAVPWARSRCLAYAVFVFLNPFSHNACHCVLLRMRERKMHRGNTQLSRLSFHRCAQANGRRSQGIVGYRNLTQADWVPAPVPPEHLDYRLFCGERSCKVGSRVCFASTVGNFLVREPSANKAVTVSVYQTPYTGRFDDVYSGSCNHNYRRHLQCAL